MCAYANNYLKLGFTSVNDETRSLRVLCLEVLAHGSLKDKILWHLEQKYVKYVDENLELFKEKKHQVT